MSILNASEIASYHERGYLIPEYRVPADRIAALRAALDRLIAENPGVRPEQLISVHVETPDGSANAEGTRGDRQFLDLASSEALLDVVEGVLGPDIILWGCAMFCKPPADGMRVPMHQDGHYWPIRPLATCTVWIALEDSDRENGCLRVVPGSHRNRELFGHTTETGHVALSEQIVSDAYDADNVVDVELEAGQMSLHDVYMIHGSEPNCSDRRRSGLAVRYMPATSYWDRSHVTPDASELVVDYSSRPLWLLRGRDVSGRNDFAAGHFGNG